MTKRLSLGKILIYIFIFIWLIMTIYPLIFTFMASFKTNDEIFNTMFSLPKKFDFRYYIDSLLRANMLKCIGNSFVISSISTVIFVFISSMAAFVISRMNIKINNLLLVFFTIGVMVPIHSTLIPLTRIVSKLNGQNSYLFIILLYATFQLPMSIFIITGYMRGISKEIDESAIIDGCSMPRLFFSIIMPLSKPIISTAAIIGFLFIYNELIFAVLFLTEKSMQTISLGLLSFVGLRTVEMGPIFASIIISIVPMVIVYLFFQEQVEKGMCAGAVKG